MKTGSTKKHKTGKTLTAIEIKDNTNMQKMEAIQPNLTVIALMGISTIERGKITAVNTKDRWIEVGFRGGTIKLFNIITNESTQKNAALLPFVANFDSTLSFIHFMIVN